MGGHGGWPLFAHNLWPRYQGIAQRARYDLFRAECRRGAVYRSKDKGKSWQRFDKVQVHGTIMSVALHQSDPKQVYLGARYDGEIFGTLNGGESWQSANPWRERVKPSYTTPGRSVRLDLAEIGTGVDECSENYCLRSSPSS